MINISIIIPHLLDDDWLRVTIKLLQESSPEISREIIVVDSGRDIPINLSQYKNILIDHHKNIIGPSEARMLGAQKAQGEILIFSDSHCLVASNSLGIIYKLAKEHNLITVACRSIASNSIGKGSRFIIPPDKPWVETVWAKGPITEGSKVYFLGGFYIISREIFKKIYFNPATIGWGGTEIFPSLRMASLGINSYYTTQTFIEHMFKKRMPSFYIDPNKPYAREWNNYSANLIHFPTKKEYFLSHLPTNIVEIFSKYEKQYTDCIQSETKIVQTTRTIKEESLWNAITQSQDNGCNCNKSNIVEKQIYIKQSNPIVKIEALYPKVSAYCPTYGRPELLEEAIESFLRQDYPGKKEMVILNDLETQKLIFDHPEIKIINLNARIIPLGKKFNETVKLCTGDILFPWDDDDIYFPHRFKFSIDHMINGCFHTAKKIDDKNKERKNKIIRCVSHCNLAISRKHFDTVGGYTEPTTDYCHMDQDFLKALRKHKLYTNIEIENKDIFYYRRWFTTKSYHGCELGTTNISTRAANIVTRKNLVGEYILNPHWNTDYTKIQVQ